MPNVPLVDRETATGPVKEQLEQIGSAFGAVPAMFRAVANSPAARGQVTSADVDALRAHGWSDEQIVETIGQVALNLFTNYVNIALDVPIDFPTVPLRRAA